MNYSASEIKEAPSFQTQLFKQKSEHILLKKIVILRRQIHTKKTGSNTSRNKKGRVRLKTWE